MPVNLTSLYFKRQLLHSSTKASTPLEVANSICGINAQRGATMYLSCWNRISHFEKKDLDRALYTTKELVKMWCMRGTVHIIPSDHFHIYQKATNPIRLWAPDISEEFCEKILTALDEPLTKSEITDRIKDRTKDANKLRTKVGRAVRMLGYKGVIVFANALKKGFYIKEYKFALAENWLPHIDSITEEEARKILFLIYLKCYGPARIQDFAYWAGFKVGEARNILKSVDVDQLEIDGKPYYMTGNTLENHNTALNHEIVLLPEYDSYVMGHKYKSRILKESNRQQVFLPYAAVAATIVKDGEVIGTWNMKKGKNALIFEITPFETIDESCIESIQEQAERIAEFMDMEHQISFAR